MAPSFQAYVDESGDEGFVFKTGPDRGSSRWFVLSAVLVRTTNEPLLNECLLKTKGFLHKQPNKPLHFTNLNHSQRKAVRERVSKMPCRAISVMACKNLPGRPNPFAGDSHLFYRYLTRLLLERVSWLCRDHRREDGGDGTAKIVFSNRSSMSYPLIQSYLQLLKHQSVTQREENIQIDWTYINPDNVVSLPHHARAGLQIADAVASGCAAAVELDQFGHNETAYMEYLSPIFYRHKDRLLSYGIKWWPVDFDQIKAANPFLEGLAALK